MTTRNHLSEALPQVFRWRRDRHVARSRVVEILVDDVPVDAHEGESLAITLAAAGRLALRHSPTAGSPRGMFCLMGVCQECLVHVDGVPVTSCMEPVRAGMRVALDKLAINRRAAGWE